MTPLGRHRLQRRRLVCFALTFIAALHAPEQLATWYVAPPALTKTLIHHA